MVDLTDQFGRAAPCAVADLLTATFAVRPHAEVMALGLAEVVLTHKLNWPKFVPLQLPERFGSAFPSGGAVVSDRESRLIPKQSAWRWSAGLMQPCAPPSRSIGG